MYLCTRFCIVLDWKPQSTGSCQTVFSVSNVRYRNISNIIAKNMATKRVRTSAKSSFTRAITQFNKIICDNEPVEVVLVIYKDIEQKFKNLMGKK